jgi:hypothetical protein
MSLHARYTKYHFATSIEIQRVRCRCCGTTHALIPLFSVPGTSLGREEAERCLKARWEGASRCSAVAELVQQGMEQRSGRSLERKLAIAVERAKAIWPLAADTRFSPQEWIKAVCGSHGAQPIAEMNRFALEHGVNAICFCRATILFFRPRIPGGPPSHKPASAAGPRRWRRLRNTNSLPGGTP